jgi:hypothetical protein
VKLRDVYRYQVWFFTGRVVPLVAKLQAHEEGFVWPDDIRLVTDVDPAGLL